ncbi:MAG: uridine kinase [Acutalibacteraceae bacterium]
MISVNEINNEVRHNTEDFILKCEYNFHKQVSDVAEDICKKSGRQIVMLAGPSSSGKTTTASLIMKQAEKHSRSAIVISLDDFYLDQTNMLYFEDGTPDFETIEALDTDYISDCLLSLSKDGKCMLPKFSFLSRKREENLIPVEAGKDDIIIVEGLHAINPKITDLLHGTSLAKLYVSVSTRIMNGCETWLSKRDIRFIRRVIRDYHFRNADVEYTFYLWNGVRKGEDRYLFPYSNLADVKIDSIHPYELCLFKNEALRLLDLIAQDSIYYNSAKSLAERLRVFESVDRNDVMADSLLHEFIG